MALRTIRTEGDSVLEKVCRPVEKIDKRTKDLVGDMLETMYDACGVGLAAPQVGILKRIVVIDVLPMAERVTFNSLSFSDSTMSRYDVNLSEEVPI